jgi:hypothetical protein
MTTLAVRSNFELAWGARPPRAPFSAPSRKTPEAHKNCVARKLSLPLPLTPEFAL